MRVIPLGQMPVFMTQDGTIVLDDRNLVRPEVSGADFAGAYDDPPDFGARDRGKKKGGGVRERLDNFRDNRDEMSDLRRSQRRERQDLREGNRDERRERRRGEDSSGEEDTQIMSNGSFSAPKGWIGTALSGKDTLTDAGTAKIRITPQHDFIASDITFDGSLSSATVLSVFFGDDGPINNPDGLPVTVFASDSMMRGLVAGSRIRAGLTITIVGELDAAGTFRVALKGYKPGPRCRRD